MNVTGIDDLLTVLNRFFKNGLCIVTEAVFYEDFSCICPAIFIALSIG